MARLNIHHRCGHDAVHTSFKSATESDALRAVLTQSVCQKCRDLARKKWLAKGPKTQRWPQPQSLSGGRSDR